MIYEELASHKAEHEELIENARQLQQKFHEANKQLTTDDIEYLSDWLTGHILGQDMRLGFFLMKAM